MSMSADQVLERRLVVQRLTSAPLPDPVDVVRLLTCVQAQDAPLARFSVGMRTAGATDAAVRAALDTGRIVRTHILRPTWHIVAVEDLRWILALTSPKVISGMAARHRQLGLDDHALVDQALDELASMLVGRRFMTRAEIGAALGAAALPSSGEQVGHVLLLAELTGLVCSGPLRATTHTYGLVDELVAPQPALERDDAVRRLVLRFFAGHGPAAPSDLARWTTLRLGEIRPALADLSDKLETTVIEGTTLWFDPACVVAPRQVERAFLLPTFDEVFLTYHDLNFPRAPSHPRGMEQHRFAEAGGGVIVCDRHDVGCWKRKEAGRSDVMVRLALADSLGPEQRDAVIAAATRMGAFFEREVRIDAVLRPSR